MSMKITDRRKAEHGVLLCQLDHLQDLVGRKTPREVLAAVVETIAQAGERLTSDDDGRLYPALARVIGRRFPLLQKSEAALEELHQLVAQIRSGSFDESTVSAFVERLREHLEREIHDVFVLAEELLPTEELASMSNWDAHHVYVVNAERQRRQGDVSGDVPVGVPDAESADDGPSRRMKCAGSLA